jgi:hypothetical protein
MMRWFVFLLFTAPAFAADLPARSLFFPSNVGSNNAPIAKAENVHNFMFSSTDSWSFWFKGARISARAIPANITIHAISENHVSFNDNGQVWDFEIGKIASK